MNKEGIQNERVVNFNLWSNTVRFSSKVSSFCIPDFAAAIHIWQIRKQKDCLKLDFSSVIHAYSNGMLPIIAAITAIRLSGSKVTIEMPRDKHLRWVFTSTNWAHFLDPHNWRESEFKHQRHLVTRQFSDFTHLPGITSDFMDVVLRTMPIPKDIVSALEWSISEICDNVINHSDSKTGGFIEVVTFLKQEKIGFTVADSGKGILQSLREGFSTLTTDSQAIGEAIKVGVTRNKDAGQGNGLAGSLRITTMTKGSLDITSGSGRFVSTGEKSYKTERGRKHHFKGTSVSGIIQLDKSFSISNALSFDGKQYTPLNIIDLNYEMADQNCLYVTMKDEDTGFGTRSSGRQLQIKILNLIESKPNYPIIIDWVGVPVISSSFADEFMGKLFIILGAMTFSSLIRNKNMEPLIVQLLDKAIAQRLTQEKD